MSFRIDPSAVNRMIEFVDQRLQAEACDHTYRFTADWSRANNVDWDDLLDALERRGAFCDCEVVLNIEGAKLSEDDEPGAVDSANRWLLPPRFDSDLANMTRMVVGQPGLCRNNYVDAGEWLVPAPIDAKPRKRVRKSVHFFVGLESGLPTEVGVVREIAPISLAEFTRKLRKSPWPELNDSDDRLAGFIAKRIATLPIDKPVGTYIADRMGVSSKHQELTIHRVFLGK